MNKSISTIVEKAGSLAQRLSLATKATSEAVKAIEALRADENLLKTIAWRLQNKPQTWSFCHPQVDWYGEILSDIREILPEIPQNVLVLVNLTHRWTLLCDREHVLPFIFLTKGGSSRLYRIVVGSEVPWLETIADQVKVMMDHATYAGGDNQPELEFGDVTLTHQPVRDEKWNVTGVHL